MTAELAHRRILLVEDETLIAMDLEAMLQQRGCEVVGPFANVADALGAVASERRLDAAILDVNLGAEKVFPVADALADGGTPFVFLTGYEREILPARHRGRTAIAKPYRASQLMRLLVEVVGKRG